jgi:quinol monooxygenase YgiN
MTPVSEIVKMSPRSEDASKPKGPFRVTIRVNVSAKKRKEALMILGSMIEQTKLEEGCISCRLYHDAQEDGALMLQQLWASEKDLHHHLRSAKFNNVLLVVEMAAEAPEIRFESVADSAGLEVIQQARTHLM